MERSTQDARSDPVDQSEGGPGGPATAIRVQAQRPIESAAERTRASVGPEGRTERYRLAPYGALKLLPNLSGMSART